MKISSLTVVIAAVFAICSTGVTAQDAPSPQPSSHMGKLNVAEMLAPIKSQQDLERYLKLTPASATPLRFLSDSARTAFLASLTFNEKGLTGFKFSSLETELNPTKIAEILSLFGVQRVTPLLTNAKIVTERDRQLMSSSSPLTCDEVSPLSAGGATAMNCGLFDGIGIGGGGWQVTPPTPPGPRPTPPTPAPGDYVGYSCFQRGTCVENKGYICNRNC